MKTLHNMFSGLSLVFSLMAVAAIIWGIYDYLKAPEDGGWLVAATGVVVLVVMYCLHYKTDGRQV